MKYKRINSVSERGKIIKDIDDVLLKILKADRGNICEIHNRGCAGIGKMHILSKGKYPRLRFNRYNIILAGWFCSHYWTHHNSEDPRAQYTKQRIIELRGIDYREQLLTIDRTSPKLSLWYLKTYVAALKREIKYKEV